MALKQQPAFFLSHYPVRYPRLLRVYSLFPPSPSHVPTKGTMILSCFALLLFESFGIENPCPLLTPHTSALISETRSNRFNATSYRDHGATKNHNTPA